MTREARAYVGLGSNLGEPRTQVRQALAELGELPGTRVAACSALYRSRPMGPADQPDYVNAVAALDTELAPARLLHELQALERRHGRTRGGVRWGPRTLDLDLLVYDELRMNTAELTIPHPGVAERSFVLYPLRELAPELVIPGLGTVDQLTRRCPAEGLSRLE